MNIISKKDFLQTNNIYFYLSKPSKIFIFLSIIIFIIWLALGPIYWRNIDDYGPIEQLFINKISFFEQIKYLPYWFWGSYPPIWHFWAFPSYIFKDFSIDLTRYILLIQGYISVIFSAYLISALSQEIVINEIKTNQNKEIKIRYLSDSLSLIVLAFNPQIMLHSMTYMPYHLGIISSLITALYIKNKLFIKKVSVKSQETFFRISDKKFLFTTLLTNLFIFQSFFIFIPSLILSIFIFKKKYILNSIDKFKKGINYNFFSSKKEVFFFSIFIVLFAAYIRKLIILFTSDTGTGYWTYGINYIYRLNENNINFFSYIYKIFFNTINIFSQSLYPYKENQLFFGYLIFIIVVISFYKFRLNSNKKFTFYFFLLNYIFAAFLASYTSVNYSPTRHNIYLFPLPIISLITLILDYYKKNINISKITNILLVSFLTFFFIWFANGLQKSHNLIQYTKSDRSKIIKMANKADYYLDLNHNSMHISPGLFQSHGDQEFNSLKNKQCTAEKVFNSDSKSFNIFYYSNDKTLNPNDLVTKDFLIKYSRGCLKKNSNLKILEKIEIENKNGIEQNNYIFNTGSNLNAYIIKVDY